MIGRTVRGVQEVLPEVPYRIYSSGLRCGPSPPGFAACGPVASEFATKLTACQGECVKVRFVHAAEEPKTARSMHADHSAGHRGLPRPAPCRMRRARRPARACRMAPPCQWHGGENGRPHHDFQGKAPAWLLNSMQGRGLPLRAFRRTDDGNKGPYLNLTIAWPGRSWQVPPPVRICIGHGGAAAGPGPRRSPGPIRAHVVHAHLSARALY
jgi:hypothetical protein